MNARPHPGPLAQEREERRPPVREVGAQDFKAAFGAGENDTTITTIDADGVALAAIQGLNQKLEERLKEKDTRIAELEKRLEKLERLLPAPAQTGGGQ